MKYLSSLLANLRDDPFTLYYCVFVIIVFVILLILFLRKSGKAEKAVTSARRQLEDLNEALERANQEFLPPSVKARLIAETKQKLHSNDPIKKPWAAYANGVRPSGDSSSPAELHLNEDSLLYKHIGADGWSAVPNLLVGLGILGTFVGLAYGIGGIDLTSSNDDLKESIRNLLSGASLAFSTSIVGLFLSILFTIIHRLTIRSVAEEVRLFAEAADEVFPPLTLEQIAERQLEQAKEQAAQLKQFNTDFATQLSDALSARLKEPFETISNGIEDLKQAQGRASDETISKVVDEFQRTLTAAAGEEMRQMAETLGAMEKSLERSAEVFQKATGNWLISLEKTTESVQRLEKFSESLESLHQGLEGSLQKVIGTLTLAAKTVEAYSSLSAETKELLARMENGFAELVRFGQTSREQWEQYVARFEQTDRTLATVFDELRKGWEEYGNEIQSYLNKLDDNTGSALDKMGGTIRDLCDALDELPEKVEQLERVLERVLLAPDAA